MEERSLTFNLTPTWFTGKAVDPLREGVRIRGCGVNKIPPPVNYLLPRGREGAFWYYNKNVQLALVPQPQELGHTFWLMASMFLPPLDYSLEEHSTMLERTETSTTLKRTIWLPTPARVEIKCKETKTKEFPITMHQLLLEMRKVHKDELRDSMPSHVVEPLLRRLMPRRCFGALRLSPKHWQLWLQL